MNRRVNSERSGLNYEGIQAFGLGYGDDFPVKGIYYRGQWLLVPDWAQNHDPGDEDDGEHKLLLKGLGVV